MQIISRIVDILKEQNKTGYQISKYLGINTSTWGTWKRNLTDPPSRYIKAIADFLNVSTSFILTGEDDPIYRYTTPDEDKFLELYRQLPDHLKLEYIGELKGVIKTLSEPEKYIDAQKRLSATNGSDEDGSECSI